MDDDAILDTTITPELKAEGGYRELVRTVQDLRKEKGLAPNDPISIVLPHITEAFLMPFIEEFQKTVLAETVSFAESSEITISTK